MKHIHHIIPKHMGGTDDPSNLIELTVEEHSHAHLRLYEQYGKKEDLCAYYMLSGKNQDPEFVKLRAQIGGAASSHQRVKSGLTGKEIFYGRVISEEEDFANCSKGGNVQGKINSLSGHMTQIQKIVDVVAAGKKGGATTIARGKGSFGDPVERLKSASKGGKTQGKKNAESGHLKRIAQIPSNKNRGMIWITNGITNMMVIPTDVIPNGYRKGKTQKSGVSVEQINTDNDISILS